MHKQYSNLEITVLEDVPGTVAYNDRLYFNESLGMRSPGKYKELLDKRLNLPAKVQYVTFIICTEGSAKARIDMKDYTFGKNEMLIISGGSILEVLDYGPDFQAASIAFTPDFLVMRNSYRSFSKLIEHLAGPNVITFTDKDAKKELDLMQSIGRFSEKEGFSYKDDAIEGALLIFSSIISSVLSNQQPTYSGKWKGSDLMRKFILELRQNYKEQRSVGFYAAKLCVSPKYFAQVIFKESGKYAKDWIREYVIRDAKEMLKSGNYTVQEVSDALHFANPSFFGKYFKEAVGSSPRTYKERFKGTL